LADQLGACGFVEVEAGVDEAGRGALAFGVVAAAVVLPPALPDGDSRRRMADRIRDSKKLSPKDREALDVFIREEYAVAYGIGTASAAEVDELNVLRATHLAMHRALAETERRLEETRQEQKQKLKLAHVVVDGDRFAPYAALTHACVPGGDGIHAHVAAASILAKVARDAQVRRACELDPTLDERYDFSRNKAYGTKRHYEGLAEHGACEHHRTTFALRANTEANGRV